MHFFTMSSLFHNVVRRSTKFKVNIFQKHMFFVLRSFSYLCNSKPISVNSSVNRYTYAVFKEIENKSTDTNVFFTMNQGYFVSIRLLCQSLTSDLNSPENELPKLDDFSNLIIDEETKKKILLILMEHYVMKQSSTSVPKCLREDDMLKLLQMNSFQREKYITRYLYRRERNIELEKQGKVENHLRMAQKKADSEDKIATHIQYGIGFNGLHYRIRKTTINSFYSHRLVNATMFGSQLVFDMDFSEHMNSQELMRMTEQMCFSYADNRVHPEPFDVVLCNLRMDSTLTNNLQKAMPNLFERESMITHSEKCFMDIFPDKEKIYLSPNARETMHDFDHDAIYIIGKNIY